jgi:hypothetical protein
MPQTRGRPRHRPPTLPRVAALYARVEGYPGRRGQGEPTHTACRYARLGGSARLRDDGRVYLGRDAQR